MNGQEVRFEDGKSFEGRVLFKNVRLFFVSHAHKSWQFVGALHGVLGVIHRELLLVETLHHVVVLNVRTYVFD